MRSAKRDSLQQSDGFRGSADGEHTSTEELSCGDVESLK